MNNVDTVAVVLASGTGERFGSVITPKHLTPLLGVPTCIWTLKTVVTSNLFSAIVVVTNKANVITTTEAISKYFDLSSIRLLITQGDADRTQSFNKGFAKLLANSLVGPTSIVALFDANRPFVQQPQLMELREAIEVHSCVCPGRPVVNGVAVVSSGHIQNVPRKSDLFEFVTPEFLRLDKFDCELENFLTGHNCLVEFSLAHGQPPFITSATEINAKLTYPEDKYFMEGLAKKNKLPPPQLLVRERDDSS